MKNLTKIFMAVAVAMLAFACVTDTTEDLGIKVEGQGGVELTLSLEESRTQLGEKVDGIYPLYWSKGDKISVNGVESGEAIINQSNPASAVFAVQEAESYAVAYPAAAAGQVLFAEKQNHIAEGNTFASGVSTMYGYGTDRSSIQLNHLTGVLKVGIKGEAKLAKVQISTIDRAPIAGAFDIDFTTGELEATTASKDVIEYSFGEGLQLTSEAQYIYVAVPAGQYDELYITLYEQGNSGNIMYATVKAGDSKPLTAGNVREFTSAIVYAPNAQLYVIDSVETLQAFKAAIESTEGLAIDAILTEDIDMTGVEWTPIAGENYTKTLIGNGYAIKGLTAPLFATTSASFKGVHLEDVNITSNDTPIMGALACTITATDAVSPKVENCSVSGTFTVKNETYVPAADGSTAYYGALVGVIKGVTINGCVNNATINVERACAEASTKKPTSCIGGVVGEMDAFTKSDASVIFSEAHNLTNNGAISYSCAKTTSEIYIGGCVAVSTKENLSVKITNCRNNAAVSCSATTSGTARIGGVFAYSYSLNNKGAMTEKNVNYGAVTLGKGTYGSYVYIAGIAAQGQSCSVNESQNHGAVTVSADAVCNGVLDMGGILGRHTTVTIDKVDQTTYYCNDCTNHGTVTMAGTVNKITLRMGGIAGYSQAKMYRDKNYGKVEMSGTVTMNGWRGKNGDCSIAGIVGYKTHGSIYSPESYGEIVVSGETKEAHATKISQVKIANIVCYSAQDVQETSVSQGKITVSGTFATEVNVGGTAAYSYNTSSSVSNDTCDADIVLSGTFNGGLVVGGVLSWAHFTTKGLTYTGTIEVTKDAVINGLCYIGGCVGQLAIPDGTARSAENMTNDGTIKFNGTSNVKLHLGGCIGYCAKEANNTASTKIHTIKNVTNNGEIILGSTSVSGDNIDIAGCVGYTANTVTTATNNGKISVNGTHKNGNSYLAGCVADAAADLTGLTNNAEIECVAGSSFSSPRLSGIVGYNNGKVSGTNLGCLNFAGSATGNVIFSGVAYKGQLENCVNGSETDKTKGVMTFAGEAGTTEGKGSIYASGLVEDTYNSCKNSVNYGTMNIAGHSHYTAYIGGISRAGIDGSHSFTNCSNYGDINLSGQIGDNVFASNKGADCFIGGLAYACGGTNDPKTYVNCHNYGNITLTESCTVGGATRIGGLFANVEEDASKLVLDGCTNNGNITLNHTSSNYESSNFVIGGCIASLGAKATLTVKNGLRNNVNITINGENKTSAVIVGGLLGIANTNTTTTVESGYLVNTGDITYAGKAKTYARIGGAYGELKAAANATVINTGDVKSTGSAGNVADSYVGGVAAYMTKAIQDAKCYAEVYGLGYKGAGMLTGVAKSDDIVGTSLAVGGKITATTKEIEDGNGDKDEVPMAVTLSETSNIDDDQATEWNDYWYKYIYGSGNPASAAEATGCSLLTSAPSLEAPAPEETPEA